MWSHSAPPFIIRLHSAVKLPKSEARTEGEIMARGMWITWHKYIEAVSAGVAQAEDSAKGTAVVLP